jgi:3'-5' exoribonuclease
LGRWEVGARVHHELRVVERDVRKTRIGDPFVVLTLLEIQHLILAHHGTLEFGSPVRPMTLEAEIVHWADEASAKGSSMSEALVDPDSLALGESISSRVWQLDNRRLWQKPHSWD